MRLLFFVLVCSFTYQANAQKTLEALLNQYNSNRATYMSVQELAMPKTDVMILDAREQSEYDVSHLKNAIFVGYTNFNLEQTALQIHNKQQPIVVYCSLGIRSETIADKLIKAGYTNVFNLYGGIFEWKNAGFPVYDSQEKETENIHAFSKTWSKWLLKGHKVFDATLDKI